MKISQVRCQQQPKKKTTSNDQRTNRPTKQRSQRTNERNTDARNKKATCEFLVKYLSSVFWSVLSAMCGLVFARVGAACLDVEGVQRSLDAFRRDMSQVRSACCPFQVFFPASTSLTQVLGFLSAATHSPRRTRPEENCPNNVPNKRANNAKRAIERLKESHNNYSRESVDVDVQ